jgi:hypothetical protein
LLAVRYDETVEINRLIGELTTLRQGQGLTLQALVRAVSVLEALGNPPLDEALAALVSMVRALGDDEPAQVLRRAYAIDLVPAGNITQRRNAYYKQTGRDIKTQIRYENRMIGALASALMKRPQRERLMVGVWVRERQFFQARVEFMTPLVGERPSGVEDTYHVNSTRESLPFFLYQLPVDYTPSELVVGVKFRGEQPQDVWAISTPHLFETPSLKYERRLLHEYDGDWFYIDFKAPQQGHFYGMGWTWTPST